MRAFDPRLALRLLVLDASGNCLAEAAAGRHPRAESRAAASEGRHHPSSGAQQRVAADLSELRSRTASIEQILKTVE
jgi:hypothetical protein